MNAIAIINRAAKPLPLSCLFHGLILLIVGLWGSSYQPAYTQESEAAVEFEMTEQELAQVKEIQQVEPEPMSFLSGGVVESNYHQQAASGSQALLAFDEAVAGGDGVVAAGLGNVQASEGGSSFAAGLTGTGTGDTLGADNNISTGSTARVESPPEPTESIGDIAGRFAARVEANKRYPSMAIRMDQQGVVVVYATLSADGNLLDYGVSSSSGYDNLDKAALKAVASSCPFSHGANGSITITVPIHFQLD